MWILYINIENRNERKYAKFPFFKNPQKLLWLNKKNLPLSCLQKKALCRSESPETPKIKTDCCPKIYIYIIILYLSLCKTVTSRIYECLYICTTMSIHKRPLCTPKITFFGKGFLSFDMQRTKKRAIYLYLFVFFLFIYYFSEALHNGLYFFDGKRGDVWSRKQWPPFYPGFVLRSFRYSLETFLSFILERM
jgi:hypothetical protein